MFILLSHIKNCKCFRRSKMNEKWAIALNMADYWSITSDIEIKV